MTVAVCIPTFNQGRYLRNAVQSALSQTHPDIEVWIADDHSSDETQEIGAALAAAHPNVHYHRQARNLGICANNNWLLAQPGTEWILRLDSDDSLDPAYIATALPRLMEHKRAAYAHVAVNEVDETGQLRRIRRLGRPAGWQTPEDVLRSLVEGYRVSANICLFRAAALREQGYYRAGMNFAEDWDLAVRFADAGWGNVYCPEILASYRVWTNQARTSVARKATEITGSITVFEKALQPAFERRGWDCCPIRRRRRALSLVHTADLDAPWFSNAEREELVGHLERLGGSWKLRARIALIRCGLGGVFRWIAHTEVRVKDAVKSLLQFRRRPQTTQ